MAQRVERRDQETSFAPRALEHAALIWTWFANSHTGPRQINGRISGRTDVSTPPYAPFKPERFSLHPWGRPQMVQNAAVDRLWWSLNRERLGRG
jgi:hypothetical protein